MRGGEKGLQWHAIGAIPCYKLSLTVGDRQALRIEGVKNEQPYPGCAKA
jgi:hypothetical protein